MDMPLELIDLIIDFTPIEWFVNDIKLMETFELSINWRKFSYRNFTIEEFDKFKDMIYWPEYYRFISNGLTDSSVRIITKHLSYVSKKLKSGKTKLPYHPRIAELSTGVIDWEGVDPKKLSSNEIISFHRYLKNWADDPIDAKVCELAVQVYGLDFVLRQYISGDAITHICKYIRYWNTYPKFSNPKLIELLPHIPGSVIRYLPKYTKIDDEIAELLFNKLDRDCLFKHGILSFEFLQKHQPTSSILQNTPTNYKVFKERTNKFVKSELYILVGLKNEIITIS